MIPLLNSSMVSSIKKSSGGGAYLNQRFLSSIPEFSKPLLSGSQNVVLFSDVSNSRYIHSKIQT